jgi:hypothetical protein
MAGTPRFLNSGPEYKPDTRINLFSELLAVYGVRIRAVLEVGV